MFDSFNLALHLSMPEPVSIKRAHVCEMASRQHSNLQWRAHEVCVAVTHRTRDRRICSSMLSSGRTSSCTHGCVKKCLCHPCKLRPVFFKLAVATKGVVRKISRGEGESNGKKRPKNSKKKDRI